MKRRLIFWSIAITLCLAWMTAPVLAYDYSLSEADTPKHAEYLVYGQTGAGRDMIAYRFGSGENVMVVGFAIHGYEDNFDRDGKCLVYTAELLMNLLEENIDTVDNYGWSIYVLPCMNPDGLLDGYTCNGPGRCTTTYLSSSGALISNKGVDLNRSFPTNWTRYTDSRNFNGSAPLSSLEAKSLAQFIENVRGSGVNICLDVHGWMSQIIPSNGSNSALYNIFKAAFPGNTYANCNNGRGYFTAYAASLGYAACLFEFPSDVYSFAGFQNSGYPEKFNDCVLQLAQRYGTYQEPGPDHECPSAKFTDLNLDAWYHDAIDFCLNQGILKGVSDTTFCPDSTLTRGMLTTILYRMSGEASVAESAQEENAPPENPFSDVYGDAWYTPAILWAAKNGIVEGYGDGTFQPDAPVTREQMVTMFFRFAVWDEKDNGQRGTLTEYPDYEHVGEYAVEAFAWSVANRLVKGTTSSEGNILDPQGLSTRAQAAEVITRYFQNILGEEIVNNNTVEFMPVQTMEPNISADGDDLGGN